MRRYFIALALSAFIFGAFDLRAQELSLDDDSFVVQVRTASDLNRIPLGAVNLREVDRTLRVFDRVYNLKDRLRRPTRQPFVPSSVSYTKSVRRIGFHYDIGDGTYLSFDVDTGELMGFASDVVEDASIVMTPQEVAEKLILLFRELGWAYQLRVYSAMVDDTDPWISYLEIDQVVPGSGHRVGASIVAFASLNDGCPRHIWISHPPELIQPTGSILDQQQAEAVAISTVFSYLNWPEAITIVNPLSYVIPAYMQYPNALTPEDLQVVRERKAYLVYAALVFLPSSWSEEHQRYLESCAVWIHAESGRVLAVAHHKNAGFAALADPLTGRKERFSWDGEWSVDGSDVHGSLLGTVLGKVGITRKVQIFRGSTAYLADFDPLTGLVVVEIDGRYHKARATGSLLKALMNSPPLLRVQLNKAS